VKYSQKTTIYIIPFDGKFQGVIVAFSLLYDFFRIKAVFGIINTKYIIILNTNLTLVVSNRGKNEVRIRISMVDRRIPITGLIIQNGEILILVVVSIFPMLRVALIISAIYTQITYPHVPNNGTSIRTSIRLSVASIIFTFIQ